MFLLACEPLYLCEGGKNQVKFPTRSLVYLLQYLHIWLHQEPEVRKQVSKQADMPDNPRFEAVG
jgi:hypothetical protein